MSEIQHNKKLRSGLLKKILAYTRPYRKLFIAAIVITVTLSFLAIARPLLIERALNDLVSGSGNLQDLNSYCLAILGFLLFETLLQVINLRITNLVGQNIVRDMRNQVYTHVLGLKNTWFDNTPVGVLVTRTISDIESLSDMFSEGFIVIVGDILMLIVFISAMFAKNWLLALLALSTIPLLFLATAFFKAGVKKTFNTVRNAVAELNTFTQEHITGMKIVQLFNKEEKEFEKFREINQKHRVANIRSIFYYSVFFPVVDILSAVSIALIIWVAGLNSNTLQIGLGDVTFFIMMVNMMFRPIRMMADRLNTVQMGIVSAERVLKVLDNNEKIINSGTLPFTGVKKSIQLKHVWFAYSQENHVLKDVSLNISAGDTVALIGATGAGKSTIINLLGRFYEIDRGELLIDGISINEYELDSLRRGTGIVLQDVQLFNDSVFNNITLRNPEISYEAVARATAETGLLDFISSLPGGFEYQVTERGQALSAGQRQLIAFIRAYVYNPPLFILDEATATIDTATEKLIQTASDKLAEGRTSIIIAHRLSTIKNAAKIFVFEQGRVVEQGTVPELLAFQGKFRKLYDNQFLAEKFY